MRGSVINNMDWTSLTSDFLVHEMPCDPLRQGFPVSLTVTVKILLDDKPVEVSVTLGRSS